MPRLSMLYLLSYNSLQGLGWALALFSLLSTESVHGAYASAGNLICLLQTASFLEVVHAAIGLVPSGALVSLLQWGGRTHFLLAVVRQFPEIIRYPHYALSSIQSCPSWLTYLRYTAFIILYPIGIAPGEMYLIHQALPFIKERNLYASFFSETLNQLSLLCCGFADMLSSLMLSAFIQAKAI